MQTNNQDSEVIFRDSDGTYVITKEGDGFRILERLTAGSELFMNWNHLFATLRSAKASLKLLKKTGYLHV